MGVGELRAAFNDICQPAFTCTLALLDYQRKDTIEFQILFFRGTASDGTPFEIKSDLIRPNEDVNQAAKTTALRLLDQRKPAP